MPLVCSSALVCLILLGCVAPCHADDEWPQFRGPDGQGRSEAVGLPVTWDEKENIRWKTAIPGEGHSSPVISGHQVWLTTAMTHELSAEEQERKLQEVRNPQGLQVAGELTLQAVCINRESGVIEKSIDLFKVVEPQPKHSLNSYASPTPVISGDRIFCHFGAYGTAAIDRRTGEVLWRSDAIKVDYQNGPGSSPVVWDNKLIIHFDGIDSQSIAALNVATGETAWQTKRSGEMDPTPDLQKAYCTPLIVETAARPLVISPAANWVYGYDARDGREIWKAGYGQLGFSTVPRPVISGDTVYIATSYMQSRLLAVKFTGEGDVTATHIGWTSDRQIPQKPSLVVVGERLYFVSDNGIVRCLNAVSGEEIWFERLPGDYSSSPLSAEDRIYFFNQNGVCSVIQAGTEFKLLGQNKLDGGIMASPAVAGEALFVRTATSLYRIEN